MRFSMILLAALVLPACTCAKTQPCKHGGSADIHFRVPGLERSQVDTLNGALAEVRGVGSVAVETDGCVGIKIRRDFSVQLKDLRSAMVCSLAIDEKAIVLQGHVFISLSGLGPKEAQVPQELERLPNIERVGVTKQMGVFTIDSARGVTLGEIVQTLQALFHRKIADVGEIVEDVEWFGDDER